MHAWVPCECILCTHWQSVSCNQSYLLTNHMIPYPVTRHHVFPMALTWRFKLAVWDIIKVVVKVQVTEQVLDNGIWIAEPNIIGFLHPTWCSILRYFARMLHLNRLPWDISKWNGIYNSMQISVVSKRCAVIVRKHWSCPKLHQRVHLRLWHLTASEEKFCSFKFNAQSEGIPVVFVACVSRIWRGIGGKAMAKFICWCSCTFFRLLWIHVSDMSYHWEQHELPRYTVREHVPHVELGLHWQ